MADRATIAGSIPAMTTAPTAAETATADLDRDQLVADNEYLVKWILGKLSPRLPRHTDWDDLWSAGLLGLVDASRRYQPETGVPFAAYASRRIHGAVLDATRSVDWASRGLRRDVRAMDRATAEIEQATGVAPSDIELAEATGLDLQVIERRRRELRTVTMLPLDKATSPDDDRPELAGRLADTRPEASPADTLERTEMVGMLRTAVHHLPVATREVLVRHYFEEEMFRDIAADLGVTEARVSQLHAEGLNALRAYMATEHDGVPAVAPSAPGVRRRAAYVAAMSTSSDLRTRLEAGQGVAVRATA